MSVWVLASDSDLHLEDITPELAMAAAAAIGAWLLLLGLFALFTRPREVETSPATMDLRPEPPAVVDYLFSRFHVTNHGVAGRCLTSLPGTTSTSTSSRAGRCLASAARRRTVS